MSVLSSRPALRWALPAGVVTVAVATAVGGSIVAADAQPALPSRTAAQLLVDIQHAKIDGLSGTVVMKADLGLPALPSLGGQGSADLASLTSGAHTLRVWSAGEDKTRLALLGTLGESDVIRNGKDVWLWSSENNTASHYTLPDSMAKLREKPADLPADMPKTPQEAADKALAAIDPSTKVTTDGTAKVAGRNAYEVVLTPRDTASKISQVRLAIDAEKKIPLRVQVFGRNAADPAIEVGFTQVSISKPGDEHFAFKAPPGVKVQENKAMAPDGAAQDKLGRPDGSEPKSKPTVIGSGWTSVVVMRGAPGAQVAQTPPGSREERHGPSGDLTSVINALPKVSGSWGSGRLLDSKLFSALITDDGRVLAGMVSKDKLIAAASDPAAAAKAPK